MTAYQELTDWSEPDLLNKWSYKGMIWMRDKCTQKLMFCVDIFKIKPFPF